MQQTQEQKPDQIAIVGMACRFPGASDLQTFWQQLKDGVLCTVECPPGTREGRVGELYEDTASIPSACRYGAFLTDIDQFDAEFFRISPSEAEFLDPQQRMMLETSWRALENANVDPEQLRGSNASVFAGMSNNDYRYLILGGADMSQPAASLYTITGTSLNTAIGRVSFALGFEGPAMTVDTACSSSLVAMHQAAIALQLGESDIALAGGVQLILSGKLTELRANAGMLSPDGTCKTFDAAANGYVRGEGCGIVVLKRLQDAVRDGDHIWAVVAATAINQDGTSEGLTVPREDAQRAVIESAIAQAGIQPTDLDYLEAHGTGTPVGDPIEINAAASVYGIGRSENQPLLIGSVKTNIGHLEPAAGVAGVIKAAMAMKFGVIPKHLNFENPNPAINWDVLPVEVVSETIPWPQTDITKRFAGINSFGFSGTNAHVVLQGYENASETRGAESELVRGPPKHVDFLLGGERGIQSDQLAAPTRTQRIFPLSAKSPEAFVALTDEYLGWLEKYREDIQEESELSNGTLANFVWTASVGRSHFNHRKALVFEGFDDLVEQLRELKSMGAPDASSVPKKLAFAYTGQGSQWVGMGQELYEREPVFRFALDRCEQIIAEERNASLIARMFGLAGSSDDLEDPKWVQPCIYALECALTDLWRSVGVEPDIVLGHSLGEIAAARTAGVFSLEDGCRFASARGRLMSQLPGPGAMAAVFLPEDEIQEAVKEYNEELNGLGVSIAAFNGAHQVVSGYGHEVEPLLERFEQRDIRVRRLKKSPAYHSALVEPILDDLAEVVDSLEVNKHALPLVSNLTGELVNERMRLDSVYWRQHARHGVAYRRGVESLDAQAVDAVLEVGPNAILGPMTTMSWPLDSDRSPIVLKSLLMPREDRPEIPSDGGFLHSMVDAYERGVDLDFEGLYAGEELRKIEIPGYAFQQRRHWVQVRKRRSSSADHSLLGSRHQTPYGDIHYETEFCASDPSWLQEHRVFDQILVPGAVFGSMGLASVPDGAGMVLEELQLHNPMLLKDVDDDEEALRQVQLVLKNSDNDDKRLFEIFSKGSADDKWIKHADGLVEQSPSESTTLPPRDLDELIADLEPEDLTEYYNRKSANKISLGTPYRNLKSLWSGYGEAIAEIRIRAEDALPDVLMQPLVLDACFQVLSAAREKMEVDKTVTYIPFGWERLELQEPLPETVVCHAQLRDAESVEDGVSTHEVPETLTGDLQIYSTSGRALAHLTGMTVKRATRSSLVSAIEDPMDLIYEIVWRNKEHATTVRRKHPLVDVEGLKSGIEPFFSYLIAQGVTPEQRYALLLDLEKLAHSWVLFTFDEAGIGRRRDNNIQVDELMVGLGALPIHQNLIGRMLEMLVNAGVLSQSTDRDFAVTVDRDDPLPDGLGQPNELFEQLREKHPYGLYELTLLNRFGSNFRELLTGGADPLALLFDEDSSGAADFYRTAPVSAAGNRLLGDVIARIVSDLPDDRVLRVIEIGAGTGATTEFVFAELANKNLRYTFTDISAGFFAEAERNFEGNGIDIEYRALDIENDPSAQGFEDSHYDIVVAANVLHATRNLYETLSNCRRLLVPGGMLIALESLRGRAWQDLTFGFLDGWWRYNDPYRKNHALASPEIWRRALADAGYVESHVFGSETLSNESGPLGSGTIVAQAPLDISMRPGTWVVEQDRGEIGARFAELFESLDQDVLITAVDEHEERSTLDSNSSPLSHPELAVALDSLPDDKPLRGVVHLAAVDGRGVAATASEIAADIQYSTGSALSLTKVLMESGVRPSNGTFYVTCGAQVLENEHAGELAGSTLWGFGKVVQLESSLLNPRLIDLDPGDDSFELLLADVLSTDEEEHIAYRRGLRYVARLVRGSERENRVELPDEPDWIVEPGQDGSLTNVQIARLEHLELEPRQVRVSVEATGLNFSDVLVALGAQDPGASLGLEFSGYVVELGSDVQEFSVGQRVVGMGFGTFGPEVVTHADLIASAPATMTFNQLATIPIAFSTVGIGFELANLKAGDQVLIHSATGGVGLAAIQLAHTAGAEVFATASVPKHGFLRSQGIEHIFDSRSLDFGTQILEATEGKGLDVVLNSLTSEGFIDASLGCLKHGGRFVEIGRLNILTPEQMARSRPDVDYHILSLDQLKRDEPETVGEVFRPLVKRFESGELRGLHHAKWPMTEIADALQYMGSALHVGKLVLAMPALARGKLSDDRTYLITGGFGGIGCAVAHWLADRGAKHIVLNGRRDPDEDASATIHTLRSQGVNVVTHIADMTDIPHIDRMIDEITHSMPPLGGVLHSVGVLSDGAIPNQTWERFELVLWPKILGAWHLHELTKNQDLDLFVLFSSATGVLGNAGQANHAAANAFLDQLAAHRRALGLAGQSIAWGAWSEIGEAAEQRSRISSQLEGTGTDWIAPELGIRTLDFLVQQDFRNPAAMSVDWMTLEQHLNSRPPLLEHLLSQDDEDATSQSDVSTLDISALKASSAEERAELLASYIQNQLQSILRLPSLPARNVGFFDLGMDSLMAVELRNRLIRVFEDEMTISRTVVFDYPNVDALANHIGEELDVDSATQSADESVAAPSGYVSDEKIAIVGLACRFPGANDYSIFWKNLADGVRGIRASRDGVGAWQGVVGDQSAREPYLHNVGFIDGIDQFDAQFFGIRPIEAHFMDPRQRMLLETCWEAIESAGIDPGTLRGSRVGVYVGLGGSEYRDLVHASGRQDSYLGTSAGMTTGRLSYVFGLMGPAMSFDLACASSLVAVHEGIKALQRREVDLALVGGANAVLSPPIMRFHRELGLLSKSGRSLPFDESADGYVRGEGCGILLLKRSEEAEQDGDPVWAALLGSAVNQNGASAGLTVPNGSAQEQVIRDAVSRAAIDPNDVDYLEAHATGLSLSDPIEISAASAVYTSGAERNHPLTLGSVKSCIGHLEWAAGAAGLIKTTLALKQHEMPAQSQLERPNEDVDWAELSINVSTKPSRWPSQDRQPLAAVSAFGMSGTNAHVLVEGVSEISNDTVLDREFPIAQGRTTKVITPAPAFTSSIGETDSATDSAKRRFRMLPLSAKSPESVVNLAKKYASWLSGCQLDALDPEVRDDFLADLVWTASVGRSHFAHRLAIVFEDHSSLMDSLQSTTNEDVCCANESIGTTFAISRGWDLWMKMGRELYGVEPVVRTTLDYCAENIRERYEFDLIANLLREVRSDGASGPQIAPYATVFSMQLAFYSYWRSIGIVAAFAVGSAISMFAARCAAGRWEIEECFEALDNEMEKPSHDKEFTSVVDATTLFAIDEAVDSGERITEWDTNQRPFEEGYLEQLRKHPELGHIVDSGTQSHLENGIENWHEHLMTEVKRAYEAGSPVQLASLFAGESRRKVSAPTYAFDRRRYWFDQ